MLWYIIICLARYYEFELDRREMERLDRVPWRRDQRPGNVVQIILDGLKELFRTAQRKCKIHWRRVRRNPLRQLDYYLQIIKTATSLGFVNCQHICRPLNKRVSAQIKLKEERSVFRLLLIMLAILAVLIFIVWMHWNRQIYYIFVFMPWRTGLSQLYYESCLCIGDGITMLTTLLVKTLVALLPAFVVDYNKRDGLFHFLETSSQLYRSLLPIPTWLIYFTKGNSPTPGFNVWDVPYYFLAQSYIVWKLKFDLRMYWGRWIKSLCALFKGCRSFSKDQQRFYKKSMRCAESRGQECCPICYDTFSQPVSLECRHVFCEQCLFTWFSVKKWSAKECPMCLTKTKIKLCTKPKYWDGSGFMRNIYV